MTDKKSHWINKLVPALAFAAGIIIASVGGMMTLSSSAKLAIFESEPYSMVSIEECTYDYNTKSQEPRKRTESEVNTCIQERKHQELERFQNSQMRNIIDGVSALFIGGLLLLAFRRRK